MRLTPLTSSQNSVFAARTATSSDTSILNAAASSNAVAGVYDLTVNQLATAGEIASQGFASATSQISQGTLTLNIGTAATNITVDSSNDTLQGLADAINASGAAVTANVVNDGSTSLPDYRLLLTSTGTGTANAVSAAFAGSGGGTQPAFNDTVQAAADASVTLGSGSGALTVSSSTNQLSSLIQGVTLSLSSAAPDTPISVTVANDTTSITNDINAFVSAYNTTLSAIQQQTSYNTTTGEAGPLLGDFQTQSIGDQLSSLVDTTVAGANPLLNNLGALGISTDDTGQLSVDSTQLANVLSGGVTGVTINDVGKLFGLTGSSTNPGVRFVTGSDQTQSSTTPYTLNVTQAAQQASLTATTALAGSTVVDGTNNTFTVNVDGTTSDSLTLTAGTYSPTQLAQAVASAINNDAALKGATVTANVNGSGQLDIQSSTYGLASQVTMESGTALSTLGYQAGAIAKGVDVAGNFVVNGVTEAATGNGQYLSGNSGNANTSGLQVNVTLNAAQVGSGISVPVTVSNGIAAQLSNFLSGLSNPVTGRFQQIDSGYQSQITALQAEQTTENTYIQTKTTQLQNQFAQMEETLAQLQNSSNIISEAGLSLQNGNSSSVASSSSSSGSSSHFGIST